MPGPTWGRTFSIPALWAQPPRPPTKICPVWPFLDLNGGPTVDPLPQARHAVALAERVDWARLGHRRVLNVNYPARPLDAALGLRVCVQTGAVWKNTYLERKDPRGAPY